MKEATSHKVEAGKFVDFDSKLGLSLPFPTGK